MPCWWSKCSVFACNVIHKISHCSGKRYISNSWDQIWIYVCSYCENNIEHTRSLEQSAGILCDNHKTSPNNKAHEETVHVEKSNYDVVSLGSNAFCFWMQNSSSFRSVVVFFLWICERRQLSFKSHTEPQRLRVHYDVVNFFKNFSQR